MDLELELDVQRHVAEGAALEPDVRPFAVVQPGHVVRGADVHVVGAYVVVELRGDRAGLRDLLRHQAVALEHVQEVCVTTEVQLVGAFELHSPVAEQARQHPVDDRRAHL